jgi:hypothetical protein
MTDKQINQWLRRQFSAVGWILILYYGLVTFTTSLTSVTDMLCQMLESLPGGILNLAPDWERINANAWGYIAAVLVAFAILDAWKGRSFRKNEIFAREAPMRFGTFLTMLFFCMGAQDGKQPVDYASGTDDEFCGQVCCACSGKGGR